MADSEIERVKSWIELCTKFQEDEWLKGYERNAELYEGDPQNLQSYEVDREYTTHTVFPIVDSNVSSFYFPNPRPTVIPNRKSIMLKRPDGTQEELSATIGAKLMEALLWHVTYTQDLNIQFQDGIRDTELGGYGAVDIGWRADIGKVKIDKDIAEEAGEYTSDKYYEYLKPQSSYTVRRDPRNYLFPPYPIAKGMWQLPFLVYYEDVPVEEVLGNDNFDRKAKKLLKEKLSRGGGIRMPSSLSGGKMYGMDLRKYNRDAGFAMCRVFHHYSRKEDLYRVYVEGVDQLFRRDTFDEFQDFDGYSSEFLFYFPSQLHFYPLAPVNYYRDKSIEIDRIMKRFVDAVDRAKSVMLAENIDEDEIQRFSQAAHGDVVQVKQVKAWEEKITGMIPPQWMQLLVMMKQQLMVESQTFEAKISEQASTDVATQMIQQQASFETKQARKKFMIKSWLKRIYRKIAKVHMANMDERMSLRISDEYGGHHYLEFSKDEIQGDFLYEIDIDESSPSTKQQKIMEAQGLLAMSQNDPNVSRRKLWNALLKGMNWRQEDVLVDIVNIDAVKMAQIEWNSMLNGAYVKPTQGEDYDAHMKTHLQQVGAVQQKLANGIEVSKEEAQAAQMMAQHMAETNAMAVPLGAAQPPGGKADIVRAMEDNGNGGPKSPMGAALSKTTEFIRNQGAVLEEGVS